MPCDLLGMGASGSCQGLPGPLLWSRHAGGRAVGRGRCSCASLLHAAAADFCMHGPLPCSTWFQKVKSAFIWTILLLFVIGLIIGIAYGEAAAAAALAEGLHAMVARSCEGGASAC